MLEKSKTQLSQYNSHKSLVSPKLSLNKISKIRVILQPSKSIQTLRTDLRAENSTNNIILKLKRNIQYKCEVEKYEYLHNKNMKALMNPKNHFKLDRNSMFYKKLRPLLANTRLQGNSPRKFIYFNFVFFITVLL